MKRSGFFILEGGEAVGKTTQLKRIGNALSERGFEVLTSREPGGTVIGESIRALLLDQAHGGVIQPMTSMLLFNASRRQWMHEIVEPALAAGKIVLGDRSFLSTMVYQSYVEGVDPGFAKEACLRAMGGRMPDRIFLLDISDEAMRRRLTDDADNKTSRYDVMEDGFHQRIREGYLEQIERFPGLIEKIDGEQPVAAITETIIGRILEAMA